MGEGFVKVRGVPHTRFARWGNGSCFVPLRGAPGWVDGVGTGATCDQALENAKNNLSKEIGKAQEKCTALGGAYTYHDLDNYNEAVDCIDRMDTRKNPPVSYKSVRYTVKGICCVPKLPQTGTPAAITQPTR